jgi:hypothetical protein
VEPRAPSPIFDASRSKTHFRRYQGCCVPFLSLVLLDSFSEVPRASGPVDMFLATGLVFGGTKGVETRFNVLRFQTRFRQYRERRVPFSCLAISDSFSYVLRASGPVFMFCTPGPVSGGTKGVESNFHVSRSRTRCRR